MDKTEFLQQQLELIKNKQNDESIEWQDITDFRSEYTGVAEHRDTVRKGSKLLLEYINAGWDIHPFNSKSTSNNLFELQKERYKVQTEKLEFNKWLREQARDEMIVEEIKKSIQQLPKLDIPEYIEPVENNKTYLFCFGDAHYGVEFEIKDLFGNVLNAYSPSIFEERMWDLFNKLVKKIYQEQITELHIFELGDGLQGIIRLNSQLMKLKYGVIDSSILYANFLANWLNELSKYVRINFQMVVDSNHNQLRICNAPKNAFPEENLSKVMISLIKERLKDNCNIVISTNDTGMNYTRLSGYNILGIHGEVKNISEAANQFSRAYQCNIDYLISAHVHHRKSEEIGQRSECISIRSLIGVDPYGMSLNKTSDAGASLFVFDQLDGLVCEYKFKVN